MGDRLKMKEVLVIKWEYIGMCGFVAKYVQTGISFIQLVKGHS